MHSFCTDQPQRYRRYILIGILATVAVGFGERFYGIPGFLSTGALSTVIYFGFTRYIWRWTWLHEKGLIAVPNLNGTWKGYLYTSVDKNKINDDDLIVEDGRQIDDLTKMETAIIIKQTWDTIQVTLNGPESPSHSRAATILVREKAWPTITYNYLNEGSDTNGELHMHYGTATLEYDEEEDKLEGSYNTRPTQRGNHGRLELHRTG